MMTSDDPLNIMTSDDILFRSMSQVHASVMEQYRMLSACMAEMKQAEADVKCWRHQQQEHQGAAEIKLPRGIGGIGTAA